MGMLQLSRMIHSSLNQYHCMFCTMRGTWARRHTDSPCTPDLSRSGSPECTRDSSHQTNSHFRSADKSLNQYHCMYASQDVQSES